LFEGSEKVAGIVRKRHESHDDKGHDPEGDSIPVPARLYGAGLSLLALPRAIRLPESQAEKDRRQYQEVGPQRFELGAQGCGADAEKRNGDGKDATQ
jgi:hypothetical protein